MIFTTSKILLLVYSILIVGTAAAARKKTYIVRIRPTDNNNAKRDHVMRRADISLSLDVNDNAILYTYDNSINGFAAVLTDTEAAALESKADVLSVTEDRALRLHTTRTPEFLGLDDSTNLLGTTSTEYSAMSPRSQRVRNAAEANIIIGVLDTGVWPENPSYDDTGMPDIPSHWNGSCEEADRWTTANCNKKLIGSGFFYKGWAADVEANGGQPFNRTNQFKSARDSDGHGTHTSTTAGGSPSANVSLFGEGSGTARGMAPDARLAIYKICWSETGDSEDSYCYESDSLAALDKAISDNVNIISGSFGGDPFFGDLVDTGTFAAMKKGIFTSFSAGNDGPSAETVSNNAPWVLTVGASSLDRDFPATVTLGDGRNFTGFTLYSNGSVPDVKPLSSSEILSMIESSQAAASGSNATEASLCKPNSLDSTLVAGKLVVCTRGDNARVDKGLNVKKAGGRGMILVNAESNGEEVTADAHLLPAVHLGYKAGTVVKEYAKSGNASASLDIEGTRLGVPAPLMAAFSSRGPNVIPQIMKPDITGPGLSVIAGWTEIAGPTSIEEDTRRVKYNVISGTSMSCPHLSGIAAYIMARRPGWSIAAIRSAIMTTAYTTTKGTSSPLQDLATSEAADPFSYGNGHVDPIAALTPGLVYNVTAQEYKDFICSVNSTEEFVVGITRENSSTCKAGKKYSPYDLNYPSFGAVYNTSISRESYTVTLPRTVTSVDGAGTYKASVSLADPHLVNITVTPDTLTFSNAGETQTFKVIVKMTKQSQNTTSHGRLEWKDGTHTVGSSLGFIWV